MSSKPFNVKDEYFLKAKEEGFRARSAYKLEGIQNKFKILKKGDLVLDVGAAPGSFLQYISKIVGQKGTVVGIDLQTIEPLYLENVITIKRDVFEEGLVDLLDEELGILDFNVITSDLAPKTSGIKSVDAGRSVELNHAVLDLAEDLLKNGGHVVMKVFPGVDQASLMKRAKKMFKRVSVFKPAAVRKTSCEQYIVCKQKGFTKPL